MAETFESDFMPAAEEGYENLTPTDSAPEQADAFNGIEEEKVPEENDALVAFQREWEVKLEEKRQNERKVEQDRKNAAAEAKEKLNLERETMQTKRMEKNRSEEQVLLEQIEEASDSENIWERVMQLVELQQDHDHAADVSRMGKLFIQLKNDNALRKETAVDA